MRRWGQTGRGRLVATALVAAGVLVAAIVIFGSGGSADRSSTPERSQPSERAARGAEIGQARDGRAATREGARPSDESGGAAPGTPPARRKPPPRILEPLPGFKPRYTVRRPGGWDPQEPAILSDRGELLLERLLDGGLSAYIGVVRSARADVPLRSYATGVLGKLREAGLAVKRVGPIRGLKVGGEAALATDFTVRDQTKRGRERQVVFYRADQVFFVTLNVQDARAYPALEPAFRRLLSSWRWEP